MLLLAIILVCVLYTPISLLTVSFEIIFVHVSVPYFRVQGELTPTDDHYQIDGNPLPILTAGKLAVNPKSITDVAIRAGFNIFI